MAPGRSRTERSRSEQLDRKKSVVASRSRSFEPNMRSRSAKKTGDDSIGITKDQYTEGRPPECVCGPNIYGALLGPTVDEQILAGLAALFKMCDDCPEELKDPKKTKGPEEPKPEPSQFGQSLSDSTALSAQSPTLESSSRGPSGETFETTSLPTDKSSVSSKEYTDAEASTESRTTQESSIVTVDAYSTSSQTTPPSSHGSESAEIETNVKSFSTTSSQSQTPSEASCLCKALRQMCQCTGPSVKSNAFQAPVMICVPALSAKDSKEPELSPCCIPKSQREADHQELPPDSAHTVRYEESHKKDHDDHESDHHSRHHTPSEHSKHHESSHHPHSHHAEHHHPPSVHSRTSRTSRKSRASHHKHKDSDHHETSSHHSRHHEPSVRSRSSHESRHSRHHTDPHHSRHRSDHRSEHHPHTSHHGSHHEPSHRSHSSHESHHSKHRHHSAHHGRGHHGSAHRTHSSHHSRQHKSEHGLGHHPPYDRSFEQDYPCSFYPGRHKLEQDMEPDMGPCCPCGASTTSSSSRGRKKVESSTSYTSVPSCPAGFKIKISRNCACQSESENTKDSSTSCTSVIVGRPSRSKHRKNGLKQIECGCKKSKAQSAIKKGPSCCCHNSTTTTTDTITYDGADNENSDVRYAITKITKFASYTTFEVMKSTRKKPKIIPTKLEGVFVLRNKKVS